MENKISIGLHGLKNPSYNDFDAFVKYAENKLETKFHYFNYFENNDKKTLKPKYFNEALEKEFEKFKDYKISLVGYSMGSVAALKFASMNNNVERLYLICPPLKISIFKWIGYVVKGLKTKKRIKKKLGKERYKSIRQSQKSKTTKNEHPFRLVSNIWKFTVDCRSYLKKLNNKDITIIWTTTDMAIKKNKSKKFLNKNLNLETNKVKTIEWNDDHFHVMLATKTKNFDAIINFINNKGE